MARVVKSLESIAKRQETRGKRHELNGKWHLTFITNLKEILQNRMTDSQMFLKDIQTTDD